MSRTFASCLSVDPAPQIRELVPQLIDGCVVIVDDLRQSSASACKLLQGIGKRLRAVGGGARLPLRGSGTEIGDPPHRPVGRSAASMSDIPTAAIVALAQRGIRS